MTERGGTTSGRKAPSERRQQQIAEVIDTAVRLFAANGFGNTGMAELCDALSMGRGQLYNLIGSKEGLLRMIHDQFFAAMFEEADRIEAQRLPPSEHLRAMVRSLMELIAARQDEVWVFFDEWRELGDVNREAYRRRQREYQAIFERIVERGIEAGEFRTANPRLAVNAILGMTNYSYQWLRPDGPVSAAEISDHFSDLVLDGLRTRQFVAGDELKD